MWESDLSSIGIICHRDRGCQCHPILDPILDPRHPLLFQLLSYFWSKTFWTWNLSSYHRCKIPYLHSCLWFYCCTHLVWEKIEKCKVLIVLLWLKNATSFCRDSQVIRMQRGARRLHNHSEREETMRITIKSSTTIWNFLHRPSQRLCWKFFKISNSLSQSKAPEQAHN